MPRLKQIVGLDIGSRTARAVWVQLRGGEPRVVRAEQMALPLEGNETQALIRSWVERLGLLRGFAAVPLPGAQVVFQPGRLAPEDPRTPAQAADMELATFNDMAGDRMASDVTSHAWSPGLRVYLMAMARPNVVTRALNALEPVGLRPADLVPAPVACFNALSRLGGDTGTPTLYLNIGHTQTELAIGTAKGLLFARSIALGGRSFTDAVMQLAMTPLAQAEAQKQRDGSLLPGGAYAEALRPAAERWYAQVATCLSAYRGAFGGEPFAVGRIVLSGGGAQLGGLVEFLGERSGLAVVKAESLPGAAVLPAAGCFDVALGAALTALEVVPSRLSLLPAMLRDEVVFREKKPYWVAAAVMGALTLGVITAGMVYALRGDARALETERKELRKREQLDRGIAAIRQRSDAQRVRCEPLRKLLRGGPAMREVISLVANTIAPDDWISLICDESAYLPAAASAAKHAPPALPRAGFFVPGFRGALRPAAAAEATAKSDVPPPPASEFNVFIVEGYTPDISLTTVKSMMERLRTAPRVRKVDLLSDDKVLPPTLPEDLAGLALELPDMRRFVMRLEVTPP
ncbi:MAG: pilus assembly protein PilM [Kiritimatiellae bacterium]|nr:pilus assembly protein PilM [Kiritimatiellia bacterium]